MPNPPPGTTRMPPRFVPTLTEVVQNEPVPPLQSDMAPDASASTSPDAPYSAQASYAASTASPFYAPQPPAVSPSPAELPEPRAEAMTSAQGGLPPSDSLEDQIIHRVMQRVDLSLERRLQEAVSAMVLAQTQLLVPRLREEIEFVVRQSVSDAVADELATRNLR